MKKMLLSLAMFLLCSSFLNAQTTYYWVGATGSATAATPWNVSTNWNTASDGSGSTRVITLVTDTLVFSGKTVFLQMFTDSVAAVKIINTSTITISATGGSELLTASNIIAPAVGTVAMPDSVLPANGNPFANLYAGNYISSTNTPGSLGQILSVFDAQHITITNEANITGANLYRIPTLIIKGLFTVELGSTLFMGSNVSTAGYSTPLFCLFLSPSATGTISGPMTYQRNGADIRVVASTAASLVINSAVNIAGCNPGAFASGVILVSVGPIFGTALGMGFARTTGNTFAFVANAPTVVFAAGSSFTNAATYKPYTPFGAAYTATSPLSFSPVTSFQPGSNYIHGYGSAYVPYFYSNTIVGFGNLTLNSVPSASSTIRFNLAATRIDSLTITNAVMPTASITIGIAAIYGSINCQVNGGLNFGSPSLLGNVNQRIYGTYSTNFNTLTINNAAGVNFFGANSDSINTLALTSGVLTIGNSSTATSVKLGSGSHTIGATASLVITAGGTTDFNNRPVTLQSSALGTASIGTIGGTLNNATNVTVQRYIPSLSRKKYTLVSSPVTSTINAGWQEANATVTGYGTSITGGVAQGTNGFDGPATSTNSIFTYNDAAVTGSKWTALASTTTAASLAPGTGYLLFVRGDRSESRPTTGNSGNTVLRATGAVGQGTVTPTLTTTTPNLFNLIANPYPCAITWLGVTKTNLSGSFYVYDPNNQLFYTSDGTTVSPSPSGSSATSQQQANVIQSGQAFFVLNAASGTPSITFTEASKTTAVTTSSNTTVFGDVTVKPQLNLNMYRTVGNVFADGVVALFGKDYSSNVSMDEDALKFSNFNENFSLRRSGQNLSIEKRPLITSTDTLYFNLGNFGKRDYSFVIDGSNFTDATAMLEDKYTASKQAIDLTGTTTYNFTVNSDAASSSNDRFIITFGSKAPAAIADAGGTRLFVKMSPNPVSNQLQVSFRNAIADETIINVINSLGQVVKTVNVGNVATGNITVPVSQLASGMYSVQLLSGGKQVNTQKIIKE